MQSKTRTPAEQRPCFMTQHRAVAGGPHPLSSRLRGKKNALQNHVEGEAPLGGERLDGDVEGVRFQQLHPVGGCAGAHTFCTEGRAALQMELQFCRRRAKALDR